MVLTEKIDGRSFNTIILDFPDEGFIAAVPDLPGCSAFGETREESLKEIRTALSLWLEAAREIGKEIPPGILSSNMQSAENDTDYITA